MPNYLFLMAALIAGTAGFVLKRRETETEKLGELENNEAGTSLEKT